MFHVKHLTPKYCDGIVKHPKKFHNLVVKHLFWTKINYKILYMKIKELQFSIS